MSFDLFRFTGDSFPICLTPCRGMLCCDDSLFYITLWICTLLYPLRVYVDRFFLSSFFDVWYTKVNTIWIFPCWNLFFLCSSRMVLDPHLPFLTDISPVPPLKTLLSWQDIELTPPLMYSHVETVLSVCIYHISHLKWHVFNMEPFFFLLTNHWVHDIFCLIGLYLIIIL